MRTLDWSGCDPRGNYTVSVTGLADKDPIVRSVDS